MGNSFGEPWTVKAVNVNRVKSWRIYKRSTIKNMKKCPMERINNGGATVQEVNFKGSGYGVGLNEPQRESDPYSVHINGARAPPWQNPGINGKMFVVPTQLKARDEIAIKGTMSDGMLDIAIKPNPQSQSIVCQLNVVYPENGQPHDQIEIRAEQNGMLQNFGQERQATTYFSDTNFEVRFIIKSGAITILVGESYLETIPFSSNFEDLAFIFVKGEVQELRFIFS